MINYTIDTDGIATITWDMPGRTMNVLNEGSIKAYVGALDKALADEKVKGGPGGSVRAPAHAHPRNVRILPNSRDFH